MNKSQTATLISVTGVTGDDSQSSGIFLPGGRIICELLNDAIFKLWPDDDNNSLDWGTFKANGAMMVAGVTVCVQLLDVDQTCLLSMSRNRCLYLDTC